MSTYVALMTFTDKGVSGVKDTAKRAGESGALIEKMGGKLVLSLWTLGQYDVVAVVEAPDDETMTAIQLAIGSRGNIRSETLRAFDQSEIQGILGRMP